MGSICKTVARRQRHVQAMSNPVYLGARCCCDAKKFVLPKNFGSRGGLDWNSYDNRSMPFARNVRCDASGGLMRHPYIRTCCDGEKFCRSKLFWIQVCPIEATTTPCPCHMHAMSDVRYLEARCNTHTFELAIDGEILSLNNFGFGCA